MQDKNKTILSAKKSSEVRLGLIAEKIAPLINLFPKHDELIFAGNPIDYFAIDIENKVFHLVEIKSGNAKLSQKQNIIKSLIDNEEMKLKFTTLKVNEQIEKIRV